MQFLVLDGPSLVHRMMDGGTKFGPVLVFSKSPSIHCNTIYRLCAVTDLLTVDFL
ncbi:hypothetical protein PILCRDRAFT_816561 [Piloderma croceum F 1598]|uniref:Uncharacterized protein n=1 Tax=Piloderma croceum (strain F 1598) TaxID=765440 RepID=A0A0C3FPE8_PILCF|nr:hypothetical protein PILCRDRAFT_816561 [Piloderma croceum F 1598]